MRRTPLSRFATALLPLLAACYTEQPIDMPVPAPDMRIVAQVTDTGRVAMSNTLGVGAMEVEGVVAGADATAWDLRMLRVSYRGGQSVMWNKELIRFPRAAVTNATQRRFSNKRSWLLAGLITSSALLAARFLGVLGGGGNTDTPPPPPH
jgi:hypothetical protein